MKKSLWYLVLTVVGTLTLTGCALFEPVPVPAAEEAVIASPHHAQRDLTLAPVLGGTLHIAMRNPVSLNPITNTDPTVAYVLGLIYEHLFDYVDLLPVPGLASDITYSDDYSYAVVTLAIRHWADGTPMTANDVIFSFNQIRNTPSSLYHPTIAPIANVQVLDTLQLRFDFNRPMGGRVAHSLVFPVIPSHHFSGQMVSRQLEPLGSGAFILQQSTLPRELILSRNPYYPAAGYMNSIRVIVTPSDETDFHALNQGIINVLPASMSELIAHGVSPVGLHTTSFPTHYLDTLVFNFDNPILANVHTRRAIAYALLDADFIYTTYLGQAVTTSSLAHPGHPAYLEGLNYHPFSLSASLALLEHAGFSTIAEGVLGSVVSDVAIPLSLRLLVNTESPERMAMAGFLQQNLTSMGIQVTLLALDFDAYYQELRGRHFDLALTGIDMSLDPRPFVATDGVYNFMGYSSQSLDYYLASLVQSSTTADYTRFWHNVQRYLNEELPLVPIAYRNRVVFTTNNVSVQGQPSLSNIYRTISQWFLTN